MILHNDVLGMALNDFHSGRKNAVIKIHSPDFETDEILVSWYFRSFDEMPEIEKKALSLCKGKILDVGAGAGSHSLYLQKNGRNVLAMDRSGGACEVMNARGVDNVIQEDIFKYKGEKKDTILMLMNGIGLCESIEKLDLFLKRIPEIINEQGQCIFDSTNLIYLFRENDGPVDIDLNSDYYGEVKFRMEYDGYTTPAFNWIYIDFDTLSWMVELNNMKIEKLMVGDNYHYLARISL